MDATLNAQAHIRQLTDRACDWMNANHPGLDGAEYDAKFAETIKDLLDIDAEFADEMGL